MKHILITGCGGLIGSQSAEFFLQKKFSILGIDNNLRKFFFGKKASVNWRILELKKNNASLCVRFRNLYYTYV